MGVIQYIPTWQREPTYASDAVSILSSSVLNITGHTKTKGRVSHELNRFCSFGCFVALEGKRSACEGLTLV